VADVVRGGLASFVHLGCRMRRGCNGYALWELPSEEDAEVTVTRGGADEAAPYADAGRGDRGGGPRERVVVGVDGTAAGVEALRWAVAHARASGSRVLCVAVSEPTPVVGSGAEVAGGLAAQSMLDDEQFTAAAEAWLADAVTALPVDARQSVEQRVLRGDAATVLLDAAREADLLVLGNHGQGVIAGALTGSVAQRCAHHVTCPLVLVPAPQRQ
jgi:nucleotide-binding universal stress UspA family protein